MSPSKKRSGKRKRTPQQQRRSTRNKKRSEKGLHYDQYVLQELDTSYVVVDTNRNEESAEEKEDFETGLGATQSTPAVITVNTPRRKSLVNNTQEVDLQTELTIANSSEMEEQGTDVELQEKSSKSEGSVNADLEQGTDVELQENLSISEGSVNTDLEQEIHFNLEEMNDISTNETTALLGNCLLYTSPSPRDS